MDLPATIAPTTTSPGLKNETVPDWSTPAKSKGAANQAVAAVGVVLPEGSFITALNFTFWPAVMSEVSGVSSTVLVGDAELSPERWANRVGPVGTKTIKQQTATSKFLRVHIKISLETNQHDWGIKQTRS